MTENQPARSVPAPSSRTLAQHAHQDTYTGNAAENVMAIVHRTVKLTLPRLSFLPVLSALGPAHLPGRQFKELVAAGQLVPADVVMGLVDAGLEE